MPGDPNSPYWRLLKAKPWEKVSMDRETYGYLLSFVAANPWLVHKLLVTAGEAIEREQAKESEATT